MSDSTPDSVPEAKSPYDQPSVRIIEPNPPLPAFTFDQFSPALQDVIRANGWSDLMLVQKKATPYLLNAQFFIIQSKTTEIYTLSLHHPDLGGRVKVVPRLGEERRPVAPRLSRHAFEQRLAAAGRS